MRWAEAKHKATLKNGRSPKAPPRFDDSWTKVYISLIRHPAWRGLSATAKDVYLIMMVKSGNAARLGKKDASGRPKFAFSYSEAKKLFNITSPTFGRALKELKEKGFVGISEYGGILGGKGKAAKYCLIGDWENWSPPARDTGGMKKARAARKKKNDFRGIQLPT